MNNKMKNNKKPQLRFPEFRNTEGWEEMTLKEVAKYENGKAHEQDIVERGDFIVVNSKFISTDGKVRKFTNTAFSLADKGDILMVLSDVPNGRAIAKCFSVNVENLYTVNQRICKITPTNVVGSFMFYILNRNPYFLAFDDGVKQTNLKNDDVLNFPMLLPSDLKEQQKIADCLTSLDALIHAQSQKCAALKVHKKGLMQQLFPAEGETVPQVRFKEWQDTEGWAEKPLGHVAEIITGNTPSTNDSNNYGGSKMFVSPADISENRYVIQTKTTLSEKGYSTTRHVKENSVLFVCIGSTIGKVAQNKIECATNQQINSIVPNKGYSSNFIYSTLENDSLKIASLAGIHAIPIINKTAFSSVLVSFPSLKEQQKIADCLTSLDALIAAASGQLAALKAHKKGLLQQLFPNTGSDTSS